MKIRIIAFFLLLIFFISPLSAGPKITISVTGKWTLRLDQSDIIGGAGGDFAGIYETAIADVSIKISKTLGPTAPWRLDIKRIDLTWHSNLHIYIKRTSDGTGDGTVSNGLTYQEITETDQYFFNGTGDRSDIDIQLKLEGVNAQLPVDDYTTEIYYTVIEV